jgi:hypothetical protein
MSATSRNSPGPNGGPEKPPTSDLIDEGSALIDAHHASLTTLEILMNHPLPSPASAPLSTQINPASMLVSDRSDCFFCTKTHLPIDARGAVITVLILALLIPAIFGTWINLRKPKKAKPAPAPKAKVIPWPEGSGREA